MPLLFDVMYTLRHLELAEVREQIKEYAEKDFDDVSEKTKVLFEDRYKQIIDVIVPKS